MVFPDKLPVSPAPMTLARSGYVLQGTIVMPGLGRQKCVVQYYPAKKEIGFAAGPNAKPGSAWDFSHKLSASTALPVIHITPSP